MNKIIGYTIGIINRSNRKIPFIVPYSAILNAEQTAIRSFISFNDLTVSETGLSADHAILHSYSRDFNLLLGLKENTIVDDQINTQATQGIKNEEIAFKYWKEIIPVLKNQPYLHYYWFTKKIEYNIKPKKHRMRPIRFSDQKITFKLTVTEKAHHFNISCMAYLNGENVDIQTVFPSFHPFFISLKQNLNLYYLFSSLKEAMAINEFVEWNYNKRITKDSFLTFKKTILLPLYGVIDVEYR